LLKLVEYQLKNRSAGLYKNRMEIGAFSNTKQPKWCKFTIKVFYDRILIGLHYVACCAVLFYPLFPVSLTRLQNEFLEKIHANERMHYFSKYLQ